MDDIKFFSILSKILIVNTVSIASFADHQPRRRSCGTKRFIIPSLYFGIWDEIIHTIRPTHMRPIHKITI